MPYGLEQKTFAGNRHAIAPQAQPERTSTIYRAWRKLSPDKRLAAVERRLNARNLGDGFPLAL